MQLHPGPAALFNSDDNLTELEFPVRYHHMLYFMIVATLF